MPLVPSHCGHAVMQVTLHRSDALTALVDIDAHLKISRADDAAGLMFGVSSESLVNKSLARWASNML